MSKKVLIFTKRVLPRSNTFVATQCNHLPSYQPIYIGLKRDESGAALIEGKETCVMADYQRFAPLSRILLDGFGLIGSGWENKLGAINADVIHANFGKGGYYCTPIANQLQLPLVTTFHGSDITQKDKFSYNKRHREVVFKKSSKILAVSKFIESRLIEAGCPAEKLVHHVIGLDNQLFKPSGEKSPHPTVLFVGRLIEQKGCQYLLQAMKSVQHKLPDTHLIVAGSGVFQNKLESLASTLNNVSFLGAQTPDQVKALMSSAWLTCLPSIRMARGNEEGLPTVCLESQAVGTPVVGFDTGGVGEGVAHEETGLLSPEKDTALLADNLMSLLLDSETRSKMSLAGINRIQEKFNVRKQSEKLETIYNSVL